MIKNYRSSGVWELAALLAVCFGGHGANGASLVVIGQTVIDSYEFGGKPSPSWSAGGLLALESPTSAEPVVHVFGGDGREVRTIYFGIPGAQTVGVLGKSLGPDGTVALCGWTQDKGGHLGHFLALAPPSDSSSINVIRTDPYVPHAVAIAPDGTIWTKGLQYNPATARIDGKSAAGVIRHFDSGGILLGSFIPQSGLSKIERGGGVDVLVSSANRVGWYQGASDSYFEVLFDGTVRRYPAAAVNPTGMLNLAVTDSGDVFVSIPPPPPGRGLAQVYSLSRGEGAWNQVSWPSGAGLILLGASGNDLVTMTPRKPNGYTLQTFYLK